MAVDYEKITSVPYPEDSIDFYLAWTVVHLQAAKKKNFAIRQAHALWCMGLAVEKIKDLCPLLKKM